MWLWDLEEKLLQDPLGVLRAGDSMASDTGVVVDLVVVTTLEVRRKSLVRNASSVLEST